MSDCCELRKKLSRQVVSPLKMLTYKKKEHLIVIKDRMSFVILCSLLNSILIICAPSNIRSTCTQLLVSSMLLLSVTALQEEITRSQGTYWIAPKCSDRV
jgi:hypothetical protein